MAVSLIVEDAHLVLHAGIPERGAEEEAVELSLRQRERSFLLDRVLGRDQEEGIGQRLRRAVHRHLPFGHRLEQCRLRLRQRAVDLVDEEDVREDRPGSKLELAGLRIPDRQPGHIGRLQVGRALNAADLGAPDGAADRSGEHGLCCAGNVLEQNMPLARERTQREAHRLVLAEDDGRDVAAEPLRDLIGRSNASGELAVVTPEA